MKTSDGLNQIQVNVFGGLGNQFFCYYAGKYLSHKTGLELTLNIERVNKFQFRSGSSLEDFNLSEKIIRLPHNEMPGLIYRSAKKMARVSNQLLSVPISFDGIFQARGLGYDSNLDRVKNPIVLNGYFQSWKYFDSLPPEDQSFPEIKLSPNNYYRSLLKEVQLQSPVIIHFRQGDYLNHSETFGNLGKKYYEVALRALPHGSLEKGCWVFSDDQIRAKNRLSDVLPSNTFWVDSGSQLSAAETLHLMTFGSSYVIANSTFSYWGAKFCSTRPFVVAPSKWFKGLGDPKELIPPYWNLSPSHWE